MDSATLKSGFIQAAKVIPFRILLNIAFYLATEVGAPALGIGTGSGLRPVEYFMRGRMAYTVIGGSILAWILVTYLYINLTVSRVVKHIYKDSLGIAVVISAAIGVSPAAITGVFKASFTVFFTAWGIFTALILLWFLEREVRVFLHNNLP